MSALVSKWFDDRDVSEVQAIDLGANCPPRCATVTFRSTVSPSRGAKQNFIHPAAIRLHFGALWSLNHVVLSATTKRCTEKTHHEQRVYLSGRSKGRDEIASKRLHGDLRIFVSGTLSDQGRTEDWISSAGESIAARSFLASFPVTGQRIDSLGNKDWTGADAASCKGALCEKRRSSSSRRREPRSSSAQPHPLEQSDIPRLTRQRLVAWIHLDTAHSRIPQRESELQRIEGARRIAEADMRQRELVWRDVACPSAFLESRERLPGLLSAARIGVCMRKITVVSGTSEGGDGLLDAARRFVQPADTGKSHKGYRDRARACARRRKSPPRLGR